MTIFRLPKHNYERCHDNIVCPLNIKKHLKFSDKNFFWVSPFPSGAHLNRRNTHCLAVFGHFTKGMVLYHAWRWQKSIFWVFIDDPITKIPRACFWFSRVLFFWVAIFSCPRKRKHQNFRVKKRWRRNEFYAVGDCCYRVYHSPLFTDFLTLKCSNPSHVYFKTPLPETSQKLQDSAYSCGWDKDRKGRVKNSTLKKHFSSP